MVPAFVRLLRPVDGQAAARASPGSSSQYLLHAALMGWTGVIAPPLAFLVPLLGIPFSWLTGFLLHRGVVRLRLPLVFVAPLDDRAASRSSATRRCSGSPGRRSATASGGGSTSCSSRRPGASTSSRSSCCSSTPGSRPRSSAGAPGRRGPRGSGRSLAAGTRARRRRRAGGRLSSAARGALEEPGPLAVGLQPNIPQRERMADVKDRDEASPRTCASTSDAPRATSGALEPDLLVWSETAFWPIERARPSRSRRCSRTRLAIRTPTGGPAADCAPGPRPPGTGPGDVLGAIRRTALPAPEKRGARDDDEDGLDETERRLGRRGRGRRPTSSTTSAAWRRSASTSRCRAACPAASS